MGNGLVRLAIIAGIAACGGNADTEAKAVDPEPVANTAPAPSEPDEPPPPDAGAPLNTITWDEVSELVPKLSGAHMLGEPPTGPATQLQVAQCVRAAPKRAIAMVEAGAKKAGWGAPQIEEHPDGGRYGMIAQRSPYVMRADVGPTSNPVCGAKGSAIVLSLYKTAPAKRRPKRR
jgi:hypothetical protein